MRAGGIADALRQEDTPRRVELLELGDFVAGHHSSHHRAKLLQAILPCAWRANLIKVKRFGGPRFDSPAPPPHGTFYGFQFSQACHCLPVDGQLAGLMCREVDLRQVEQRSRRLHCVRFYIEKRHLE
jgi:hypothetical protein